VTETLLMIRPLGDRRFFLRNSAEIERVKKEGRRLQTPLFNLLACPAATTQSGPHEEAHRHSRIGIVVGKRLGQAVARNRAKRIFRELARWVRPRLVPARDLLVFPRREALTVPHAQLRDVWLSALRREGLLASTEDSSCNDSRLG
jgi:ribonuclease P protein component